MNPLKFRVFAALAICSAQAVAQLTPKMRLLLSGIVTLVLTVSLSAQTAEPSALNFDSAPGASANGTFLGAKIDTKTALTTKIKGAISNSVLVLGGDNADQFVASLMLEADDSAKAQNLCSDNDLKTLKCVIAASAAGRVMDLTVNFAPTSSGQKTAEIFFTDLKPNGNAFALATLTGTGYYAIPLGCSRAYSDCDQQSWLGFSLLGGLEQSYLSAETNQTDAFLRVFTKVSVPVGVNTSFNTWGVIRDLGAPSANSTQNIVTAISNPDGTITSQSLSTVGYSLDFLVGVGMDHLTAKTNGQYSLGPILAIGATTPLTSASATTGYKVPALGTEECSQLQQRFAKGYLVPGKTQNCLYNTAGTPSGGLGAPVTTLAFAGINRSDFLEKYELGIRTIYRTYSKSGQSRCDVDDPCNRGVLDLSVGQDEAITGGLLRHFVFKMDGVQPFPYSGGYLYLFGTVAVRSERNADLPPLVLTPATTADLQAVPSPHVFVEPFKQPDKDFYRIGVGLSIDKLFKKKS